MATIKGSNQDDALTGTAASDIIYGFNGHDILAGGAGDDFLYGGNAHDRLFGDDGADRLFGENGEDILYGGNGNDRLNGGNGNDWLDGGVGNDRLNGGTGDDIMAGGAGNDLYYVDSAGDVLTENAGEGLDTVISLVSWTLGDNFERLTLNGTADIDGTGNALANVIVGNAGANQLRGEGGNDQIKGGAGDDRIEGGVGRDNLFGGTGADLFVYRDGDFSGGAAANADRINDFSRAQGDRIDLSLVDADSLSDGDQAFSFIGSAAFSNAAGELRAQVIDGTTFVYGDTNGDGVADFTIALTGAHALTEADFVI